MSAAKAEQSIANLRQALDRLQEALNEPESNALVIDGTIQRFEFVIELYWKTLRRLLSLNGIQTGTPREAISEAFRAGWIGDEPLGSKCCVIAMKPRTFTTRQWHGESTSAFAATTPCSRAVGRPFAVVSRNEVGNLMSPRKAGARSHMGTHLR